MQHMENCRYEYLEEVKNSVVYVDDLMTGDTNVEKVKCLKKTAIDIFQKADFELHKWYSIVLELKSEFKPDQILPKFCQIAYNRVSVK